MDETFENMAHVASEQLAKRLSEQVDLSFEKGFMMGLLRHTWMKDGTTYVGNGTYTLKEAKKMAFEEGLISSIDLEKF